MKFIVRIVMICLMVLIVGCNYQIVPITPVVPEIVKPPFAGDYKTKEMRNIWSACYIAFMQRSPYTPPETSAKMCDCYVDELRKTHPQSALKGLTKIENDDMGKQLIAKCNGKPLGTAKKMEWL